MLGRRLNVLQCSQVVPCSRSYSQKEMRARQPWKEFVHFILPDPPWAPRPTLKNCTTAPQTGARVNVARSNTNLGEIQIKICAAPFFFRLKGQT